MSGGLLYLNLAVNGFVQGLVIGLAALALSLVFAVARFPNAATGDLMTVGAYTGIGVQSLNIRSVILQGTAAVLACGALAILYYWLVLRHLRGRGLVSMLLASMGLALATRGGLSFFVGQDQYLFNIPIMRPYVIGGLRLQILDLWLAVAALVSVAATFAMLFLTPVGRRMRAIADNPELARASGIRVQRVMIPLWAVVGAICGIAGMILGIKTVVLPESGWHILLPAFAAMVLGGLGNPVGAVVAGIILGVAQELSTPFVGFTYKIALSFIVLAGILAVRPQGLFGSAEEVR